MLFRTRLFLQLFVQKLKETFLLQLFSKFGRTHQAHSWIPIPCFCNIHYIGRTPRAYYGFHASVILIARVVGRTCSAHCEFHACCVGRLAFRSVMLWLLSCQFGVEIACWHWHWQHEWVKLKVKAKFIKNTWMILEPVYLIDETLRVMFLLHTPVEQVVRCQTVLNLKKEQKLLTEQPLKNHLF